MIMFQFALFISVHFVVTTNTLKISLNPDTWNKVICKKVPYLVQSTKCLFKIQKETLLARGIDNCSIKFACNDTIMTGVCCNLNDDSRSMNLLKTINTASTLTSQNNVNFQVPNYDDLQITENSTISITEISVGYYVNSSSRAATGINVEENEPFLIAKSDVINKLVSLGTKYFDLLVFAAIFIAFFCLLLFCFVVKTIKRGLNLFLARVIVTIKICFGCKKDVSTQTNPLELDKLDDSFGTNNKQVAIYTQPRQQYNQLNSEHSSLPPPVPELLAITNEQIANSSRSNINKIVANPISLEKQESSQTYPLSFLSWKNSTQKNPFASRENYTQGNFNCYQDTEV